MVGSSEKSRKASLSSRPSSASHSVRLVLPDLEEGSSKLSSQFDAFSCSDVSATGG